MNYCHNTFYCLSSLSYKHMYIFCIFCIICTITSVCKYSANERLKKLLHGDSSFSKPSMNENADPSEGLMSVLKKIYTDGDDEMKRTINKAWVESQDKKTKGDDFDFWVSSLICFHSKLPPPAWLHYVIPHWGLYDVFLYHFSVKRDCYD